MLTLRLRRLSVGILGVEALIEAIGDEADHVVQETVIALWVSHRQPYARLVHHPLGIGGAQLAHRVGARVHRRLREARSKLLSQPGKIDVASRRTGSVARAQLRCRGDAGG